VPGELTRIFSDLHYGDHASRVDRLAQLRPLLDGVTHLVLNGDTLDTRVGPFPAHTAECRAAVKEFFPREVASTSFLTGNHDGDFSSLHHLDLANGKVFVTHGDIFFDDIVPWSHDAALISHRIAEELRALPTELHDQLDHRLELLGQDDEGRQGGRGSARSRTVRMATTKARQPTTPITYPVTSW